MKKLAYSVALGGALVAAGMSFGSHKAFATENYVPHLAGSSEGLAAGALPPPGKYFINDFVFTPAPVYNSTAHKTGTQLNAFIDIPIVLYVPHIKLLGAQYAAAIAQPMDWVQAANAGTNNSGPSSGGLYNTFVAPLMLSWALPNHFHLAANLGVYIPDGKFHANKANGGLNSIGYWAVEPNIGLSWLNNGWNLSANIIYDHGFANKNSGDGNYKSGDTLTVDYTATKTIGKWTLGLGGYSVNQLQNDKADAGTTQATNIANADGNKYEKYAAGPFLGYNFGPVDLQGWYNQKIYAKNGPAGSEFWTRILIPF